MGGDEESEGREEVSKCASSRKAEEETSRDEPLQRDPESVREVGGEEGDRGDQSEVESQDEGGDQEEGCRARGKRKRTRGQPSSFGNREVGRWRAERRTSNNDSAQSKGEDKSRRNENGGDGREGDESAGDDWKRWEGRVEVSFLVRTRGRERSEESGRRDQTNAKLRTGMTERMKKTVMKVWQREGRKKEEREDVSSCQRGGSELDLRSFVDLSSFFPPATAEGSNRALPNARPSSKPPSPTKGPPSELQAAGASPSSSSPAIDDELARTHSRHGIGPSQLLSSINAGHEQLLLEPMKSRPQRIEKRTCQSSWKEGGEGEGAEGKGGGR